MKCAHLIAVLSILIGFSLSGQQADILKKGTRMNIKYQVAGTAGICQNRGGTGGLGLQIRYQFNNRWFADARTFSPISMRFDPYKAFVWQEHSINSPLFNQTSAIVGHSFLKSHSLTERKGLTPERTGEYEKDMAVSWRGGYYFYQQTQADVSGDEYYIVNKNSDGDLLYRSGIIAHSISAGLDFFSSKTINRAKLNTHHVYVDFLFAVAMRTTGFGETPSHDNYLYRFDDSQFKKDRVGARIGYEFTRNFSKKWGVIIGAELVKKPTIVQVPNRDLYVPRGSVYSPIFASIKLGISYTQLRSVIKGK